MSRGLQIRREREISLCLKGLYAPPHPYEMDIMDLLDELNYYQLRNNSVVLYELASDRVHD